MTDAVFEKLKQRILRQLEEQLPGSLTYHNAAHTKDVLEKSIQIAIQEGITEDEDLMLLKVAALFHDNGFLEGYGAHEERSCDIMREQMRGILKEAALEKICGLIMATKIPQTPKTHLEEIICDADLDYLGRNDFEYISNALRLEFLAYNIVKDDREWEEKQISFFEEHHYFTATSNNNRNTRKQQRLAELKENFSLQYGL
jgi:uncharacterized protein